MSDSRFTEVAHHLKDQLDEHEELWESTISYSILAAGVATLFLTFFLK